MQFADGSNRPGWRRDLPLDHAGYTANSLPDKGNPPEKGKPRTSEREPQETIGKITSLLRIPKNYFIKTAPYKKTMIFHIGFKNGSSLPGSCLFLVAFWGL